MQRWVWLGCSAVLGCGDFSAPPITTTTVTSARPDVVPFDAAIVQLGDARCSRELSCDDTVKECITDLDALRRDYLVSGSCTAGVPTVRLSRCVAAMHEQVCSDAQNGTRLDACTEERLCR